MKKKELKAKIKQLESDLRALVLNPNSEESIMIKYRVTITKQLEDNLWMGDTAIGPSEGVHIGFYSPDGINFHSITKNKTT